MSSGFCSKLIKLKERRKSRQANLGKTGAAMQARKRKCINYTYVDLRTFQKNSFRVSRAGSYTAVHCWKKKRDFLIIRSKVGGFLILTVDGNEYFVG